MGIKTEDTLDQAVTIKMNSLGWLHLWLLQLLFVSKSSLCNPVDCSPPGSSVRGVSQIITLVGCHLLLQGIFLALPLLLTSCETMSRMFHFLAIVYSPAKVRNLYLPNEPHEFVVNTKRDTVYKHV